MAGCRPLTEPETKLVMDQLHSTRDRLLFILGLKTGLRVSELLSLVLGDLVKDGEVLDRVLVSKRFTKGKVASRSIVIHPLAKEAIKSYVAELTQFNSCQPLFLSRNQNGGLVSITRFQAHKILKGAFAKAGLMGTLATHTMRKTFASRIYTAFDKDLILTQKALGHKSILSTVSYLDADQTTVDRAVLAV